MSGKLEVSFNSPQCGWMSIGFDDGVNEFHTTTAHSPHQFALPELLRILAAVLDANSTEKEYLLNSINTNEDVIVITNKIQEKFEFLREQIERELNPLFDHIQKLSFDIDEELVQGAYKAEYENIKYNQRGGYIFYNSEYQQKNLHTASSQHARE